MRRLGSELGVEAMSLYKHVDGKDHILDGMIDTVIAAIDVPDTASDWKAAMRGRAASARSVLLRHSWAIGMLEARGANSSTTLDYTEAMLGALRTGGFSVTGAVHAFVLLDSFVYGHVIQEAAGAHPRQAGTGRPDPGPHLAAVEELAATGTFSFDAEFEFGLELLLDALDVRRGAM